jgi:hypothetical protein
MIEAPSLEDFGVRQPDPVRDAGEALAVRAWAQVAGTREGRRVLWDILEQTGIYRVSFTGEAEQTAFNEGVRSVGLRLMARLGDAAPEHLKTILIEQGRA